MSKLTVVFSGKKASGKSSAGKFVVAEYLNFIEGKQMYSVAQKGKEAFLLKNKKDIIYIDKPGVDQDHYSEKYSVKMYSFADPLKVFCINVLGLEIAQCYGSDDDKNSPTHIMWEDMPIEVREKHSRPRRGSGGMKPASGFMTAREVMQVFGTDICRKIDTNCWARGLYSIIKKDDYKLSVVPDARFPNEITLGTESDAKVVRLLLDPYHDDHESECALDDFPLGEYTKIVDNQKIKMVECHKVLVDDLRKWFIGSDII